MRLYKARKARPLGPVKAMSRAKSAPVQPHLFHSLKAEPTNSNFFMTKRPHSPNMPDAMHTNGETEPQDGREPKRRRSAPLPLDINVSVPMKPEKNVDVIDDGDVLLVVSKLNDEEKP